MGRKKKSATEARSVQLGIRCEIWLKQKFEKFAEKDERTLTQVMREALKQYAERRESHPEAA